MSVDWRQLAMQAILADGKVDEQEVKILTKALKNEDGKYDDEALGFLIDLRNSYSRKVKAKKEEMTEAFENFFFKIIQGRVLQEGKVSTEAAGYLRETLFPGAKVDERGYTWLTADLPKKMKEKAPEFEEFMLQVEQRRAKAKKA